MRSRAVLVGSIVVIGLSTSVRSQTRFTNVTVPAGITHQFSHNPGYTFYTREFAWMTGGAVAEDFDGDGWDDLFVLQGGAFPDLLYMNRRNGTFANEAAARGAAIRGPHVGAAAADYDNDGDVDLFVSSAQPPHMLLINDGSGHFSEETFAYDAPARGCTSPSWGDLNNDGLLELVLGAWDTGLRETVRVYRNLGAEGFQVQQTLPNHFLFTPTFADFTGDGFQDVLLTADFGNTIWYLNDGSGMLVPGPTSSVENGMGSAVGDIDADGDLDVFISSIRDFDGAEFGWGTTGNRLHRNDGTGRFTDVTTMAGVRDGYWGWGGEFLDFDNDGDLDLFHVNGWLEFNAGVNGEFDRTPARAFENTGSGSFVEIGGSAGDAADTGQGRAVVVFDYDRDGDCDIFIANCLALNTEAGPGVMEPGTPVLLRNDTANGNHWLKVSARGLTPPHHAHGLAARVFVQTGTLTQMRELNASSGYNGHGPERVAHFGLGPSDLVDLVRVRWPNRDEVEIRNVPANQEILLSSPVASVSTDAVEMDSLLLLSTHRGLLEPGLSVEWTVDGSTYPNNTSLSFDTPGLKTLTARFYNDAEPPELIRTESFRIEVLPPPAERKSVAQLWNEQNLAAIRIDFPDPTKHARNLLLTSIAMWDTWAVFDPAAVGVVYNPDAAGAPIETNRDRAISYAAYRVLSTLYGASVNSNATRSSLDDLMEKLGYDASLDAVSGGSAAAVGNRIGFEVLRYAAGDGHLDYETFMGGPYEYSNEPLPVAESGTVMIHPNRWQPLLFEVAITQNGQTTDLVQRFLGPHWGGVRPFAIPTHGAVLYFDPGPPPQLGGGTDAEFKAASVAVIDYSSQLDPADGVMIDISPGAFGNNSLGMNDGAGHPVNPVTGHPYPAQLVKRADFGRVLAEFWADGPDSETPPGHWNVLANKLHDHPSFERRFEGAGPELDRLEWDVKVYLALNGALHDSAISAWGCKRVYDFVRPISSIRHMGSKGQSSDPSGPSYDPNGMPLVGNLVEVITADSAAPGQRHAHLAEHVGEIAIRAWKAGGPTGGVRWIRAVDWLPYQRDTFVTPAFPGYVSGHSTFSRAAAEVLARITGSEYFPGGLGSFTARRNEFLQFERGPTTDAVLQWATYYDAADQAGISRLYGGIHVPVDDGPGRIIGSRCGRLAYDLARKYYDGSIASEPMRARLAADQDGSMRLEWDAVRGGWYRIEGAATLEPGAFGNLGPWIQATETRARSWLSATGACRPHFFRVKRQFPQPEWAPDEQPPCDESDPWEKRRARLPRQAIDGKSARDEHSRSLASPFVDKIALRRAD